MQDIILINKPLGITSFDVIRELRNKLGIKKIGHAGTLDPLAEGLLIIGLGKGTKQLTQLVGLPKTYIFEILFGMNTTTGDMEGEVIEKKNITKIAKKDLELVLHSLLGKNEFVVPLYSAIKIKGKPLYKYAREGIDINPPKRIMDLRTLELLSLRSYGEYQIAKIELNCSSGTYVRTVAEEIGKRLGLPATTKSITRTAIGDFKLKDAYSLDAINAKTFVI